METPCGLEPYLLMVKVDLCLYTTAIIMCVVSITCYNDIMSISRISFLPGVCMYTHSQFRV